MATDKKVRVRFAPSPTGALHIGGIRTALYNYLFAKKSEGDFILRIEDTDQNRKMDGAEEYILNSLHWLGLVPDEGPEQGGPYGPYRQSERKDLYGQFARLLLDEGYAYIAFDTEAELDDIRKKYEARKLTFKYDASVRHRLQNSLHLSSDEVNKKIEAGEPYVIRMLVPEDEEVTFFDIVRDRVTFDTNELDDKVILKADGMPTYHLANIVDDYHMKISHVIRGEEWISSTAHHVLLYQMLGWEDHIPEFVHLPLILKPGGGGKLSKRDGAKMNIPVFPLQWTDEESGATFQGFREEGFLPAATLNFLALLGWSPGNDREIFNMEELTNAFMLSQIIKSGARFDIDKARWFNQQYLIKSDVSELLQYIEKNFPELYKLADRSYLEKVIPLFLERIHQIPEIAEQASYFFSEWPEYDKAQILKKYKTGDHELYRDLFAAFSSVDPFEKDRLKAVVEEFVAARNTKYGVVLPILRLAVAGVLQGPDLFAMMEVLGKSVVMQRLEKALVSFPEIK
ncbi:MAG TPA: glutamate--tRNA ligase [Membranihabitans sp.]|nr:glutamate--tRNA ligase [Membranihabitans sp.]